MSCPETFLRFLWFGTWYLNCAYEVRSAISRFDCFLKISSFFCAFPFFRLFFLSPDEDGFSIKPHRGVAIGRAHARATSILLTRFPHVSIRCWNNRKFRFREFLSSYPVPICIGWPNVQINSVIALYPDTDCIIGRKNKAEKEEQQTSLSKLVPCARYSLSIDPIYS